MEPKQHDRQVSHIIRFQFVTFAMNGVSTTQLYWHVCTSISVSNALDVPRSSLRNLQMCKFHCIDEENTLFVYAGGGIRFRKRL